MRTSSLDATTARNYAVRFFLVGLFARNVNLERFYFYNWGGTKIPIVLQAGHAFPLCNVALYIGSLAQPGEQGLTFLYAHAAPPAFEGISIVGAIGYILSMLFAMRVVRNVNKADESEHK